MRRAGYRFRVVTSSFKEKTFPGNPRKTVVQNAVGKARSARVRGKTGHILGADTMIYFRGRLIGKPKSRKYASQMLSSFSNRGHDVYTGVALIDIGSGKMKLGCQKSKVKMKKLTDEKIQRYLKYVNPMDKAGAYAIQEHGYWLIRSITGSRSNVIGLPMELLKRMLIALRRCR